MSYRLEKPYTDNERADFIVKYNHSQGLDIEETEEGMVALEPFEKLVDGIVTDNTEVYETEKEKEERERLNNLTMTKRVLWLQLKELGITYKQLKDLIATNEDAQAEWDLCETLKRDNPLLDIMGAKLNITPEQIDNMFKIANGELPVKEESAEETNGAGKASGTSSNQPADNEEEE